MLLFSVLMTSFSMPKTTTFLAITPCYDGNKSYAKAMIMTFGCPSLYHKKGSYRGIKRADKWTFAN